VGVFGRLCRVVFAKELVVRVFDKGRL
jgi:hypothetical protein